MPKYIISLLLLASAASADTLKYNPFTDNLDITGAGATTSAGGGIVSPGTFPWANNNGLSLNTITVSSNSFLSGSTFYANGDAETAGDLTVHFYDNVRDSKLNFGQWQIKQITGDGNLYFGRYTFGEGAAITFEPNSGAGGQLDVKNLSITTLNLPLTPPLTFPLNIGQQAIQSQNTDGNFVLYDLIYNRKFLEIERDSGDMLYKAGTIQADRGVRTSTLTFTGSSAPPDGYALCLSSGRVGHCTTAVGAGGDCTCAFP